LPGGVEKDMASRGTRYLKVDPSLPNPYTAVWVSGIKDATAFRTKREAQAIKGQVKDQVADVSGVTKGMDGFFYGAR
jgi:hypothetical protein